MKAIMGTLIILAGFIALVDGEVMSCNWSAGQLICGGKVITTERVQKLCGDSQKS